MSEDSECIEFSLSFLQQNHENLSEYSFEANSFFDHIEQSMSMQISRTDSKKENQTQKDITFEISDLSGKRSVLAQKEQFEPGITEATLPARPFNCFLSLTVPSKFYCKVCESGTVSIVSYEENKKNWWGSIYGLFKNMKCCGENKSGEYVLVHRCKSCRSVLARIYSTQVIPELRIRDEII